MSAPLLDTITYGSPPVTSPLCPLSPDASSAPLKTMQAMSHKQPADLPIGSDHPQSTFIEEVEDKDLPVPPSGPPLISHATIQHVNDPDFIDDPGPARSQVPLPSDGPIEGLGAPNSNDNPLPFLGDPEPEFFVGK